MNAPEGDIDFSALYKPRNIAVVGASASSGGPANNFLRGLKRSGYAGDVFPVHPHAQSIEGFPAYRSINDIPCNVDYAYIAVAAQRTPAIFKGLSRRIVFAQVVSSGFSEVAGGLALEQQLVTACRQVGVRLLGPNCLGVHSPRGLISFVEGAPLEQGTIGVLSQSGGLSIDIIGRGHVRGLRFSAVVSLGNCADLGVPDLLQFLLDDPLTKVIGLYLEDVVEGRRFYDILRAGRARKPIVLLKGGRTKAGQRASSSHTGSLAQEDSIWVALSRQTGVVLVDTLDQLLDALLTFQFVAYSGPS